MHTGAEAALIVGGLVLRGWRCRARLKVQAAWQAAGDISTWGRRLLQEVGCILLADLASKIDAGCSGLIGIPAIAGIILTIDRREIIRRDIRQEIWIDLSTLLRLEQHL